MVHANVKSCGLLGIIISSHLFFVLFDSVLQIFWHWVFVTCGITTRGSARAIEIGLIRNQNLIFWPLANVSPMATFPLYRHHLRTREVPRQGEI